MSIFAKRKNYVERAVMTSNVNERLINEHLRHKNEINLHLKLYFNYL